MSELFYSYPFDDESDDIQDSYWQAVSEALLYGYGFIKVSKENGMKATCIKPEEYDEIIQILKFIKENKC